MTGKIYVATHILSYFLFSLYIDFKEEMRYHHNQMTAYNLTHTQTISPDVAERRAAQEKLLHDTRIERESYHPHSAVSNNVFGYYLLYQIRVFHIASVRKAV